MGHYLKPRPVVLHSNHQALKYMNVAQVKYKTCKMDRVSIIIQLYLKT